MSNNQRNVSYVKRKYLEDVTNIHETQQRAYKTEYPDISVQAMKSSCIDANESNDYHLFRNYQNVHPLLGWYKADLDTGVLSYDQFRALLENVHCESKMVQTCSILFDNWDRYKRLM